MAEIKACVSFSTAEGTVISGHYSYHLRFERASAVNSAWILTGEVLSVGARFAQLPCPSHYGNILTRVSMTIHGSLGWKEKHQLVVKRHSSSSRNLGDSSRRRLTTLEWDMPVPERTRQTASWLVLLLPHPGIRHLEKKNTLTGTSRGSWDAI